MKSPYTQDQELIEQINKALKPLQDKINALSNAATLPASQQLAAIVQLIDNSDFSWSKAAYTTAGITPATAGDDNQQAYNWFRQTTATTTLVFDHAHALKATGDSLFAANEGANADIPRWNRVDGWSQTGSVGANWDISYPLSTNFVTPSMRFYFQCIARLRTLTSFTPVQIFAGFWDNTVSVPDNLPDWIRGSAFTLNAATFGPLGATTIAYKLIVTTDAGDTIESATATVTNAPASLSATNGVALTWPRYPGFTTVSIYKTVAGVSYLVFIEGNGANAFNDVGQTQRVVSAVPSGVTTARAYAQSRIFSPTADWQQFDLNIPVPQTYNFSKTTANQCLRFGLTGATGDGHQVEIDRIGISVDWGLWSPTDHDKNAPSPASTTQTSSSQGPPSGGGDPPDSGGGGPRCSTLDTLVTVCDEDGEAEREIPLGDVTVNCFVPGRSRVNRVQGVRVGWTDTIIDVTTENGAHRRCSPSDRWIRNDLDLVRGTAIRQLGEGETVLTRINKNVLPSKIARYSLSTTGEEVAILRLEGDHIYFAGGAACHNEKPLENQF